MKKSFFLMFFLLVLVVSGCQTKTEPTTKDITLQDYYQNGSIDMVDKGLKSMPDFCGTGLLDSQKTGLVSIYLGTNEITEIVDVDLSCLTSLKVLDLSFNKIDSIKDFRVNDNLFDFEISNNYLSDLSWINASFINLKKLNVGFNKLTNLNGVENIKGLLALHAYHNEISDITDLKDLNKLREVKLEFNKLKNVDVLENFKNLKHVTLKYNEDLDNNIIDKYQKLTEENMK